MQAPIQSSLPAWINAAHKLIHKINLYFQLVNIINLKSAFIDSDLSTHFTFD